MMTQIIPKIPYKFSCVKCDVKTNNKKDYNNHILTQKHAKIHNLLTFNPKKRVSHICDICNKEYSSRQSLHLHKNKCINPNSDIQENQQNETIKKEDIETITNMVIEIIKCKPNEENIIITPVAAAPPETIDFKNMVIELMKSNQDLQNKMFEMCKNNNNNNTTINNNQTNINNKTLNLQFFLNEQCKDAMNISDFAKSFDFQLADLESVGELGYVEGISKLIVNKLNDLDIYKRPIHCSDAKRETLYVKDQDKWAKEESDNPKIRKAIKNVSYQNIGLINKWRDTYPECRSNTSESNQKYINIVRQAMGGSLDIEDNENKIIRRLAREVIIKKNE